MDQGEAHAQPFCERERLHRQAELVESPHGHDDQQPFREWQRPGGAREHACAETGASRPVRAPGAPPGPPCVAAPSAARPRKTRLARWPVGIAELAQDSAGGDSWCALRWHTDMRVAAPRARRVLRAPHRAEEVLGGRQKAPQGAVWGPQEWGSYTQWAVFCRLRGEDCFTRDPMSPCSQVADQAARRVRSKPPS
ncbi:MAG: hypothetical protein ACPIOQ_84330 [Promethearchaeia archaeon]